MSNQGAVDYLLHALHAAGFIEDITDPLLIQRVNEAKAMEREQIVEAFQCEWNAHNSSGKKYYENKYGKEASHES